MTTPTEQPDALRLAKGLRDGTLLLSERDEAAEWLERLVAEREADGAAIAEWSERACNLQHELNVALRERDQARFDLATSVRTTAEHGQTIMADREAMRMALEALKTELSHGPLIKECHDAIEALKARGV